MYSVFPNTIINIDMKRVLLVSLMVLFIVSIIWGDVAEIPVFTYHTHAPFIIGDQKGLSYDLADYLNVHSNGKYLFRVMPMSRARVDKMLKQEEAGIIPWVNPAWFQDLEEINYMWTHGILMEDGNAVVSNNQTKLDYDGPRSILNLRFGGIRGHNYEDINDLVDAGEIIRVDAVNHIDNLRKLTKNRIDFTIVPLTGAQFLIETNNLSEDLFISAKLHSTYSRRIIISDRNSDLLEFLEPLIQNMSSDPSWQIILSDYKQCAE